MWTDQRHNLSPESAAATSREQRNNLPLTHAPAFFGFTISVQKLIVIKNKKGYNTEILFIQIKDGKFQFFVHNYYFYKR